jgi:hypothetical protein
MRIITYYTAIDQFYYLKFLNSHHLGEISEDNDYS